uniref:Uncharacterized protein n=1 Tax=viral metagenome TaxID=1070528 RepID=A0A6C0FBT4_9ZZZZ|tara:strand:- start:4572 stop:4799 length:228 start_codon:yes stop_codon:yes gene_type:complete
MKKFKHSSKIPLPKKIYKIKARNRNIDKIETKLNKEAYDACLLASQDVSNYTNIEKCISLSTEYATFICDPEDSY